VRKLTEVAERINLSNAQRAHANPRSRVLRVVTSSLSSASSPASKAAAHRVQASSRAWASPLATPYDNVVPVPSSSSWIFEEAALVVPSGASHS
jgi:hypothetical protein